jgi:hypothetical protein
MEELTPLFDTKGIGDFVQWKHHNFPKMWTLLSLLVHTLLLLAGCFIYPVSCELLSNRLNTSTNDHRQKRLQSQHLSSHRFEGGGMRHSLSIINNEMEEWNSVEEDELFNNYKKDTTHRFSAPLGKPEAQGSLPVFLKFHKVSSQLCVPASFSLY